jgi:hypothetical protein
MKPLSADTAPEIAEILLERYRQMTPLRQAGPLTPGDESPG